MKKIKIMTVVGTRPEIIRLSETIKELNRYTEHILVHTGQNYDYELNQVFFKDFGLPKPDFFLESASSSPSKTVGRVISNIDDLLDTQKPDALLILGDTNSALAAYAAKRRKIPVFHAEAGNRCFDQRVPEELNRKIVDHISDLNMVYSDEARRNLLREGIEPHRIIKTGSPMKEVLTAHKNNIQKSRILNTLKLKKKNYFLCSLHRDENVSSDENIRKIADILNTLAHTYNKKIVFPMHPRTRKAFERIDIKLSDLVIIGKPLGFFDFVKLQINALCVLSDSGTISEETAILGLTSLNLRESHERLEAMDEGVVMMVGLHTERILQALAVVLKQGVTHNVPHDYMSSNFSKKVIRIIISYLDSSIKKIGL
jgi:UDP-N-acetylglucosamine 2-epimerase (non-hydrolysing)